LKDCLDYRSSTFENHLNFSRSFCLILWVFFGGFSVSRNYKNLVIFFSLNSRKLKSHKKFHRFFSISRYLKQFFIFEFSGLSFLFYEKFGLISLFSRYLFFVNFGFFCFYNFSWNLYSHYSNIFNCYKNCNNFLFSSSLWDTRPFSKNNAKFYYDIKYLRDRSHIT
jgi:hypothetical protein